MFAMIWISLTIEIIEIQNQITEGIENQIGTMKVRERK